VTPPPLFAVFLIGATVAYLALVEIINYAECIVMLSRSRQCLSCRDSWWRYSA
jgi:hypothetical protein